MAARTPHALPEPPERQALEQLPEKQAGDGARAHLRLERRACRLLDLDNFAGGCKALIDCLKEAGFLADDDPGSVEITFAQVKVRRKAEEGTAIHLTLAAEDSACALTGYGGHVPGTPSVLPAGGLPAVALAEAG